MAALEAVVLLVAVLMETGVIGASGAARRPAAAGNVPQPGWSPVQGIPPALAGADPTVTYLGHGGAALGQPTFDATADPATVVGAPFGGEPTVVGSGPSFGAAQEAFGAGADQTVVGTGASPFASFAGSEPATTVQAGTARPGQPSFVGPEPATAVAPWSRSRPSVSRRMRRRSSAMAGRVRGFGGSGDDVVVRDGRRVRGSADPATTATARGGPSRFGEKADPAATAVVRAAQSPFGVRPDPATTSGARSAETAADPAAAGHVPFAGAEPATTATVPGTPSTAPGAQSPFTGPSEQRAAGGSFPGSAESATARGAAQAPLGGAAEPGAAVVAPGLPRRGSADSAAGSGQPDPGTAVAGAAEAQFGASDPAGPGGVRRPGVFAVGESGAVPLYGGQPTRQAPTGSHPVPNRHGDVPTPRYGQPGPGQAHTGSHATPAQQPDPSAPRYGLAGAVNGSSGPHRGASDAQASTGSHRAPPPDNPAATGANRTPPSADRASGAHPLAPESAAPRYGPADEAQGGSRTQREAEPAGGQERGATPSNGRSRADGRAASPGTSGAHRAPMSEGSAGANGTAQPDEGSVPLFGSPATNGASGPSHAAPTSEHPIIGQAKVDGTSGPSHAARTGEHPVYGLFTSGSRSARRAAAAAAQERRTDGTPTTQGESARPQPNRSGREPGDATGSPHGTASAKPEPRPSVAESDPTPETTAFPVQQARSASDPTPAWGQAALPDETKAATPGWLGRPDGAGAPPAPRSPTENRPGRHGHPDEARKDTTRVFPSPER